MMQPGTCIHFNGLVNDKCRKDITYTDAARPLNELERKNYESYGEYRGNERSFAVAKRIPCFDDNGAPACPFYEEPGKAQLEEHDRLIASAVMQLFTVRPLIEADIAARNKKKKDYRGSIPCPICNDGKVAYSYAGSYNGHIHAQCTTDGCVAWME